MTQAFNLSQLANNLDSSGRLDATDGLVNAVPVANGGTGASSVAAAVSNLSQSIYPIGSIYINASVATNPSTLLGFGTWVAFGAGRVMVGLNSSDSLFDTLQETGGSKDATLVSHTHTATSNVTDPGHAHNLTFNSNLQSLGTASIALGDDLITTPLNGFIASAQTGISVATTIASTGSSGANANLQPYITVSMWIRTA
jgi:hypothetical protein